MSWSAPSITPPTLVVAVVSASSSDAFLQYAAWRLDAGVLDDGSSTALAGVTSSLLAEVVGPAVVPVAATFAGGCISSSAILAFSLVFLDRFDLIAPTTA